MLTIGLIHVKSFGLGQFLGTDMPIGSKGLVLILKFTKECTMVLKLEVRIISNSIGQG